MESDELIHHIWRYWYEDGIAETLGGLGVLVAMGLSRWASGIPIPDGRGIVPVVFIAGALLGLNYLLRRGIRRYKERVTYPRTGYVSYQRRTILRSPGRWVAIGFLLLAGLTSGLGGKENLAWILLIVGIALWEEHTAATLGLARFHALAVYTLLVGACVRALPQLAAWGLPAFIVLVGLGYVVSGASALVAYLRRHPEAELAEEEGA